MSTDVLSSITAEARLRYEQVARPWDVVLLFVVLMLVGYGVVMLYSASVVMATDRLGHHLYLVESQLLKIGLGVGLLIAAMNFDYRWYKRLIYPILLVSGGMLALVLIPGIGSIQNGSQRWFSIAGMSFQPAEVVKIHVGERLVLSLWAESAAHEEIGAVTRGGTLPFTLAHNVATPGEVDAVLETARAAGATVFAAEQRDWGGYTGYFTDPDNFRWEIAYNPHPVGNVTLV